MPKLVNHVIFINKIIYKKHFYIKELLSILKTIFYDNFTYNLNLNIGVFIIYIN